MIRDFLRKFMSGRYGPDHLGTAILVASLVLSIVFQLLGLGFIGATVSYVLLALMLFRILSRNIAARRRENDRFLRFWDPARNKIKKRFARLRDFKTHKYFTCPGCHNTLRVPRGRGTLQITCPRCGERFIRKT